MAEKAKREEIEMKIPFRSDAEIESATLELLRKYSKHVGSTIKPPIPVDGIIEKYLRITLEIVDMRARYGAHVLGAAFFEEQTIRVEESLEDQEGRLCFTMGHEVGHWQLHRPLYEMEKVTKPLFDSGERPPSFLCRSDQRPPEEIQADKFAASLLMPSDLVRRAFRSTFGDNPRLISGLTGRSCDAAAVSEWSKVARAVMDAGAFSNVSVEAMRYRLAGLQLVVDASAGAQQQLFQP